MCRNYLRIRLERWTSLPPRLASDRSSYTVSSCVLDIPKSSWFLLPISFPLNPRELCDIVLLNTFPDFLSVRIQSNVLSAPPCPSNPLLIVLLETLSWILFCTKYGLVHFSVCKKIIRPATSCAPASIFTSFAFSS